MANEIRLRRNNIAGTITDNPLAIGTTTINSAGFVDLPVVDATNHLILVLDPLEVGGPAEIVMVTAHSAAATSVTVVRGQEGTVARSMVFGTTWFHGPVASDYTLSDVTSATRPSVPYTGELILESDTKKLMGYTGTTWAPRDAGGQIGFAETAAATTTSGGVETTMISVANVPVAANRRIKISARWWDTTFTVSGDLYFIRINEDGIQVDAITWQTLTGSRFGHEFWTVRTPTAGLHTYALTAGRSTGTGTLSMNGAAGLTTKILVEDIGAA